MASDFFAGDVAARYDDAADDEFAPATILAAIEVLAELAGDGRVLEFGIGTGRIAVPLHERGVPVHGIDLSSDMIAQLRAKPGTAAIGTSVGDFATTTVPGTFSLAVLVFNTIMNLTTQDEQVACFRNAAAHLEPGGRFVIEVLVPQLQRLAPGDTLLVDDRSPGHVGIDEYDVGQQGLISHHYFPDRGETVSMPFRYVWPAELDLMARLAGLVPEHRWADWDRGPFTATSTKHVSVWQRPKTG